MKCATRSPRDEFVLNYQPLIDLRTQRVTAVEALLRWHHPEHGPVSPETFIPIAEKCGLIAPISEWVLRTACTQVLKWPDLRVAVNLSPVHFRSRELIDTIKSVLKETGLAAGTARTRGHRERAHQRYRCCARHPQRAQGARREHRDGRFRHRLLVARLSELVSVRQAQDRPLVHIQPGGPGEVARHRPIGALAGRKPADDHYRRGRRERSSRSSSCCAKGCQQVQGYFFGRPVPARELTAFLRNWKGFGTENAAA